MSLLFKIALGALCVYVLIGLAAYFGQRRLMYFPDRARTLPVQAGLIGVEERVLNTPDGARIIAWYGKAKPGQPTILYFHGNAGSLANRAPRVEQFMAQGWGVYMMTYRGYGGGTGSPTETANVADARLAYGALLLEGVEPGVGHPLWRVAGLRHCRAHRHRAAGWRRGAGCALHLDRGCRRTGLSLPARALPARRPLRGATKYIGQVRAPLLILHGERDPVIPVAMGRELFRLANEPKRLATFPNGSHSDLYLNGNGALEAMRDWIRGLNR